MDKILTFVLIAFVAIFFVGGLGYLKDPANFNNILQTTIETVAEVESADNESSINTPIKSFATVPIICGVATFGLCSLFWFLTAKGTMDNGPQYAVTVGVAFTFIGIIIALYNFKVDNVEAIRQSISAFLDGMKTAFITSIIGIIFSLLIGIFTKAKTERRNKNELKDYFKNISSNTNELTESVLKISKTGAAAETVADSMIKLKESLEGSNLGVLKKELGELSDVMKTYVEATKNSSNFVQDIAEHLNEQSKAITELNKTLAASATLQTRALNNLSEKLNNSGAEQIARLDAMNQSIAQMKDFSQQSSQSSAILLNETRAYQNASLENDREQARILAENTQRITEMRNAFDEFLDKMTSVFSEKLIDALNSSIQDLNNKLTEQFGDNFKQLNAAVVALKDWQDNYKSTIEQTVGELTQLNAAFKNFAVEVAPVLAENTARLGKSADSLAESSSKNVDIQLRLLNSVQNAEQAAQNLNAINSTLVANQQAILNGIETSFRTHTERIESITAQSMDNLRDAVEELNNETFKTSVDMENNVKRFNDTVADVLNRISLALDNFDTDFKDEIKTAMTNLQNNFETIAKSTGDQGREAVTTLATTLGKITERMVTNYTTLVDRIDEVDKIINSRRSA